MVRRIFICLFLLIACESRLPQDSGLPNARISPADSETTIAFLGDSITEGYGIEASKAFPALVEKILNAKGKRIRVANAGVSGSTSASAPSRMRWIMKSNPDWVVLALGANDGLRGLDTGQMEKNLTEAIKIAADRNIKILMAGIKIPPNYGHEYAQRFENAFLKVSKTFPNIVFLPFLLEGVGGEKHLNLPDGIHPNEKGHEIIANHVAAVLEKAL